MKKSSAGRFNGAIACAILLGGCIGPLGDDSRIDRSTALDLRKEIPEYDLGQLNDRRYSALGIVSATSCYRDFIKDQAARPEDAVDRLRLEASRLGANGILNSYCTSEGVSLRKQCWYSYSCYASAIRVSSADGRTAKRRKPARKTGSAFFVNSQAYAITNHHVVDGCGEVSSSLDIDFTVFVSDIKNDLAILTPKSSTKTRYLKISKDSRLNLGQKILVVGYPRAGRLSEAAKVTAGTVSSKSGAGGDQSVFQISAPIRAGSSGAPVLDASGNVIGIVVSIPNAPKAARRPGEAPKGINFAAKKDIALSLLNSNEIDYETSANLSDKFRPEAIAEAALPAVFSVTCDPA